MKSTATSFPCLHPNTSNNLLDCSLRQHEAHQSRIHCHESCHTRNSLATTDFVWTEYQSIPCYAYATYQTHPHTSQQPKCHRIGEEPGISCPNQTYPSGGTGDLAKWSMSLQTRRLFLQFIIATASSPDSNPNKFPRPSEWSVYDWYRRKRTTHTGHHRSIHGMGMHA